MKFQLKKVLLIVSICLICLIFNFAWLSHRIYQIEVEKNFKLLLSYLDSISSHIAQKNIPINPKNIDNALKNISHLVHVRLTFISPSGKVLGDSLREVNETDTFINTKEFKEALKKGKATSVRYDRILDKYILCAAKVIYVNKKLIGVMIASKPVDELEFFMSKTKRYIFYSEFFEAIILIVLLVVFYYMILSDIKSVFSSIFKMFKPKESPSKLERNYIFSQFTNIVNEIEKISKELYDYKKIKDIFSITSSSAIVITDSDGMIKFFNDKFNDLFNRPKVDLTKLNIKDIFRNFEFNKIFYESQSKNQPIEAEIELFITDSFYPFFIRATPVKGDVMVELVDISKLKRLESFEKELITNINHELKTPLSIIKGFTEALKEEIEGEDIDIKQVKNFTNTIYKHVLRLEDVLNNILFLIKDKDGFKEIKKVKLDLAVLLEEVIDSFKIIAEKSRMRIEKIVEGKDLEIYGNSVLLRQAIANLLENAIKFSPPGSKIEVRLKKEKDGHIALYVKDEGIGIPFEYQDKIFEKFFKVNSTRQREGSGLGLFITKKIVELHNGNIKVVSAPQKGSTFIITFEDKAKRCT